MADPVPLDSFLVEAALIRRLLADYDFDEVVRITRSGGFPHVQAAGVIGRSLLALDFDDFRRPPEWLPADFVRALRQLAYPMSADAKDRGALGDIGPVMAVALEALAIRVRQQDVDEVLEIVHLISEYLPHLAWQTVLGHAIDPAAIGTWVAIEPTSWGREDPRCAHRPHERALASRVLRTSSVRDHFGDFLLAGYSGLGKAMLLCGTRGRPGSAPRGSCTNPSCRVWTQLHAADRPDLEQRLRVALAFRRSPLVTARHHAAPGHVFALPTLDHVVRLWRSTAGLLEGDTRKRPFADPLSPDISRGVEQVVDYVAAGHSGPSTLIDRSRTLVLDALDSAGADRPPSP